MRFFTVRSLFVSSSCIANSRMVSSSASRRTILSFISSTSSIPTTRLYSSSSNNYVFGYGSLICPKSRRITAPSVADRESIPVTIDHIERVWCKKSKRGMTSMGVIPNTTTTNNNSNAEVPSCNGVLLPVTTLELQQFDEREIGYDRIPIPSCDIRLLVRNGKEEQEETSHWNTNNPKDIFWVYVPQEIQLPTREYPIVQSYLDVIIGGCLTISKEFAINFLKTTKGWSSPNPNAKNQMQTTHRDVFWINDRLDPIYSRFDPDYSLLRKDEFDELLDTYLAKTIFKQRKKLEEEEWKQ